MPVDPVFNTKTDLLIRHSLRFNQQPFRIENPDKLENSDSAILLIDFDGGKMILSSREADVQIVKGFLRLEDVPETATAH
jgi:hypothetical protein